MRKNFKNPKREANLKADQKKKPKMKWTATQLNFAGHPADQHLKIKKVKWYTDYENKAKVDLGSNKANRGSNHDRKNIGK